MSPELWQKAQEVFLDALEQPAERRQSWARAACAGDGELWQTVSRLLAGHDSTCGLLSIPEPPSPDELRLPCLLGTYRLLEKIGQGGMGAVYRAERADGQFEMQAAIKLISGDALNSKSVKRFLTERQILARLDHYHIARLLDGGVAGDGRPYIVMEHVNGVPIDAYCRDRRMTVEQTVRLFEMVCAAVEYAHAQGVIHRDIKPGNLLVTSTGIPKLLDFGISKLLETGGAPDSTVTLDRSRRLTPDYASPEQLLGRPATPASDVYSLGVLLHKLLYGERPKGDSQVRRHRIGRDLDAIVTKALAQRPEDRYPSGKELREDVERYLRAMPVAARPRAVLPRLAKSARRYRWQAMSATVLVAAIAIVGLLVRDNRRKSVERKRQAVIAILALFYDADHLAARAPRSADARLMELRPMLPRLEALERDSGEDAEVLYRVALGYAYVGRGQAAFPNAVGDFRSGLETFQRAAAIATRAAAKSGGVREKQLLVQILHRVIITALWSNESQVASAAVADGLRLLEASQAQFRLAGLGEFAGNYRIAFLVHRAHILQSENRLEEAAGIWSAAIRELPPEVVLKDSSPGYVGLYAAQEANLRLAEQYCWSGNPRAGAPYSAAAQVLAARISEITRDPDVERQARAIGAVCETKANRPGEALHTLRGLQRAYEKDVKDQPRNSYRKDALANCDRLAGDAMVEIGDWARAAEAYRAALSLIQSPAEFASSPAAEIRKAQIAASMARLESEQAFRSPRNSAPAARHSKAACAYYEQADAIFRKRRTGVMYIDDRVAMTEVEKAFPGCDAAGYRMPPE